MRPIIIAAFAGGCGGLYGMGIPLGDTDRIPSDSCKVRRATGSLAIDEHGEVRTVREGRGEVECEGEPYPESYDVRRAARIEIDVLGQPVHAGEGWYAYTRVYDAHDNMLYATDDVYAWSAQNAEIHPGVCGDHPSPNCERSYSATFVAQPGPTTLTVRYRGVTASLTLTVLPKR